MKNLSSLAHIEPDTRCRVSTFADHDRPFVTLRIEGDFVEVVLMAKPGASEALRTLAAAATEAADALDAMAADEPEVSGRG